MSNLLDGNPLLAIYAKMIGERIAELELDQIRAGVKLDRIRDIVRNVDLPDHALRAMILSVLEWKAPP